MTTPAVQSFVNAAAHQIGYQIDTAWQRAGAQLVLERLNTPAARGYLLGLFDYLLTTVPVPETEREPLLALLYGSFVRDPETALDLFTQRPADRTNDEVRTFAQAAIDDARDSAAKGARSQLLRTYLEAHQPHHVALARRG